MSIDPKRLADICAAHSLTAKQTAFVIALIGNGRNGSAAYRAAYNVRPATTAKSIFVESSKLLHHRKNIAVLQEIESKVMPAIIQHAIDLAGITKASIMLELAKKGFANMEDYTRLLTTGERVIDMSNCSRDQLAAVQEIVVKDFKDRGGENVREVRRIKLKLYGKLGALVEMGREIGMFVEKKRSRSGAGAPARP